MAKKELDKAGGVNQPKPPEPSTDNDYLRKQIALNPNNKPRADDEEVVSPSNKLKAGKKK